MARGAPQAEGKLAPEINNADALHELLDLENSKFCKYVQHPKKKEDVVGGVGGVAASPAGGEGNEGTAMKVYLTKKERKRIRRTTRMERERCLCVGYGGLYSG